MNRITGYAAAWWLVVAVAACGGTSPPSTPADRVLLQGDPAALAIQATTTLAPVAAQKADIDNGIVMTKIDVRLAPDATVGQVNAALALVDGGIVSMRAGSPALTVVVPRASNVAALRQAAQTLAAAPGIAFAHIGRTTTAKVLPPSPAGDPESRDALMHLLPARFPAAWNAARLATQNCEQRKVPVLLIDHLPPEPGEQVQRYAQELPGFSVISGDEQIDDTLHGFAVAAVLGARFDGQNPTGASPYTQCLDLSAINVAHLTVIEEHQRLLMNLPSASKFILNRSLGYRDECPDDSCTPDNVRDQFHLPVEMAVEAVDWIRETASRWDDFLIATSAGNSRNESAASIYPGLGVARVDSDVNLAADPSLLDRPVPFAFAKDPDLWQPDITQYPDYPTLAATDDEMERLARYAEISLGGATPAPNVLVVGSVTSGSTARPLVASDFSDSGPDLHAVGEDVFALFSTFNGTSVAAPQVAGLASYLWLLSPELRSRPASVTRQAILANTQRSDSGLDIIDAYASALSLDQATLPTPQSAPVRLAILDLVPNGRFDEADLEEFVAVYFDPVTGDPREPENRNYRPWDLNGDGFGGGSSRRAPIDLDREGSTQFGATKYSTVRQQIEGQDIAFDERAVTDMQILCYYAYSLLYTGSDAERRRLMQLRCLSQVPKLPATGQANCYGWKVVPRSGYPNGFLRRTDIPCAGTGQDADTRAGVPWPSPRFSADGPCVTDRLTGLMWGLNEPGPQAPRRTWQQGLDHANSLDLCGFTDWRMPNKNEIWSLHDHGFTPENDWFYALIWPDGMFPATSGRDVFETAWSSTSIDVAGVSDRVWLGTGFIASKSERRYVVPVRSAFAGAPAPVMATNQRQCHDATGTEIACTGTGHDGDHRSGVPWPEPRFVVGTGPQANCVTDKLTGLVWMREPPVEYRKWPQALAWVRGLDQCGFTDWRMPNVVEMRSVYPSHVPWSQAISWLQGQGFRGLRQFGGGIVPQDPPKIPPDVFIDQYWTSSTFDVGAGEETNLNAHVLALPSDIVRSFRVHSDDWPLEPNSLLRTWPVRGGVSASPSGRAGP